MDSKRILIGITGASGAALALELLRLIQEKTDFETHVIMSRYGEMTLEYETGASRKDIAALSTVLYDENDCSAAPASGSFRTMGMVVVPCSMKTLSGIAHGYCDNLLGRAADVTIKERRTLVLVPRESPLSPIHLENLLKTAQLGAVIVPPVPAYYNHPQTMQDVNRQIAGKILGFFEVDTGLNAEWEGLHAH